MIWEIWGCWEKPNGVGGPHGHTDTPIFDNNTSARWIKPAMKFNNPMLLYVVDSGQQANRTSVLRRLHVMSAATFHSMESSHLQPRIWLTRRGNNWMMMLRCCAQIQEASQQPKEAYKSSNGSFPGGLSGSSDKLESSDTVLLVSLPITRKALLLMWMWLGYTSTIKLWILPLQVLWPIESVHRAAQLQISHCEDGMHRLDGCSRISVVGGYFSGTLEGGRMGDNLECFGEVLGLFLVFCLFYYDIGHIHAWRAVPRVPDVKNNHWDTCFGKGIVAAIQLCKWLSCNS